jgi:hypothetical protein
MKDQRMRYLVVGVGGCLVAVLLCVGASMIGVGGLAWFSLQDPEGVDIQVIVPPSVTVGDEFVLAIHIKNIGAEPQYLKRVDIMMDYLQGFELSRSTPIYTYRDRLSLFGIEVETFEFQEMILEGETLVVDFDLRAVQAGDFSGNMDVCISSMVVCKEMATRTLVGE